MPLRTFPDGFIFGTATASYQIEGATDEDGRGESIWDRFSHTPGKVDGGDTGDVACDHYHRVDQDIELMRQLGVGAYRFSVAWPRVIPDGAGDVNARGLDFYSGLVDKLLAAGITPYVTMYHWDLPQALEDAHGGWRSRKTVEAFARYADTIVQHLGDRVTNWMTVNEMPCVVFLGHLSGQQAPGACEDLDVINQIQHHVLLAHGHGVRAVREHGASGAEVGVVHNPGCKVPVWEAPEHIAAAAAEFKAHNGAMLEPMARGKYPEGWLEDMAEDAPEIADGDMELIGQPTDFMGFNVYSGMYVAAGSDGEPRQFEFPSSYPQASPADWIKIVPQSVYWGLRFLHELYDVKKLYVSENGCAMDDQLVGGEVEDTDRMFFFRAYMAEAARAASDGVPLVGYFAWSLMDNFEWAKGYRDRFGLHYVDFKTQQRFRKLSGDYYAACIRAGAVL